MARRFVVAHPRTGHKEVQWSDAHCISYTAASPTSLFLATFLYAIAFVGGFAVPTRLDGPAREPFATALAIDALLLGSVRGPAQRDGAALVQALVDADRAVGDRALHLRAVREPRARPAVLAMAPAWRNRVEYRSTGGAPARLGGVRVRDGCRCLS